MSRAVVERKTKETQVTVELELDGTGAYDVQTGNPFLTHMLESLTRYAGFDLKLRATGDLDHHLIEDAGMALGQAFRAAFALAPCVRIAHDVVPMDDALVLVAVDLVDRPYYEGQLPIPIWEHFLRSFAMEARINLHVDLLRGRDSHHAVEGAIKGFGRALRRALAPREEEVSTKGVVHNRIRAASPSSAIADSATPDQPPQSPHMVHNAIAASQEQSDDQIEIQGVMGKAAPKAPRKPRTTEPAPLSLEEEEIMAELEKGGWSWREGAEKAGQAKALKSLGKRGLVEVRNVHKDGRTRLEARKKVRKAAEDPGTIVAPPKLGAKHDSGPIAGVEPDEAGAASVKPESLQSASGEVSGTTHKRDLPEVKAAKRRDREIHGG